jgi:serine/threonine protein kinase/tetratricopeptide (TPR) repeat protein
MIGQTISHYKILEKLGEGGMGVVYQAEDTKLKRIVALKFLPSHFSADDEVKQRFLHEAQAASALNHTNICSIHTIEEYDGQQFIDMELVEGKTLGVVLKEKELSLKEIVDIALQIAEGLNVAHKKGIVHRDIKPDNIMVTDESSVKIMDFGLAKLRGSSRLTKTHSTLGTLSYMSPEQARGEEVDQSSDIFSFGAVLYEMVTGRRPFKGEHEAAIIYSLVNETPEPLARYKTNVPNDLQRIIDKALSKERGERYQHVDEMIADLRRVQQETSPPVKVKSKTTKLSLLIGSGIAVVALIVFVYFFLMPKSVPPGEKSVAVLPFVDMSPQKDQEYFCDGMSEELINRLTKIRDLRVPARTSTFMFKGKTEDVRSIGNKLNVKTVLEGSVRKAGNSLRVTAQLINVADGYHLWSETYDRELKDVFAIQDEVASAIVNAFKLRLSSQEKEEVLASRHNLNPEAHNLYLQGRYFRYRNTYEDVVKSLPYFQQAIQMDSTYALGWSGLADIYLMIDLLSGSKPKYHSQSLAAVQKALDLDPLMPEAHVALGIIRMCYEWNWSVAQQSLERAIELNPNAGQSHYEYGVLLQRRGKIEASIDELKRGTNLDPLAWVGYYRLGISYSLLGDHKLAIEHFTKALELISTSYWRMNLQGLMGWEYFQQGFYEKAQELMNNEPLTEVRVEVARGNRQKALGWLAQLEKSEMPTAWKCWSLARAYAYIGDNDKAIANLERVYELYPMILIEINIQQSFRELYSDPRFVEFLKKIGLEK